MERQRCMNVRITGRVQGVAYRAWTQATARRLGLTGWVRNKPDGSVAALIAGDEPAVEAMLTAMREGPGAARVTDVWADDSDEKAPEGFEIRG